ncbi:MAG TPA: DUF2252 domain-containing protein [Solirubrobacteraceae bacterium]|jgi:uncharacterized protein (DUF2252 family)
MEVPHPAEQRAERRTVAARARQGREMRKVIPRSAHGEWQAAPDRPDPIELLEEQSHSRVPELGPIRYGRMLVSAFTFFRGTAAVMASDLADAPRTGLQVQLCGDAHLSNFGTYAGPDRRLVFSVNDFDETLPGPFEWDVKRLVASFAVAGRDRGFDRSEREAINLAAARSYRRSMQRLAGMRAVELWYADSNGDRDLQEILQGWARRVDRRQRERFERDIAKARAKDSLRAFAKLTDNAEGGPRIIHDPPLIVPLDMLAAGDLASIEEVVQSAVESYRGTLAHDRRRLLECYRYVHAARKVVGVGSVGTRAVIALMLGRDDEDPLFLQIKEAQASVLERYLGHSEFSHHGQRVVEGQRLMQATSDIMLGWIRATWVDGISRDFYVRQLWDGKGSAEIEVMDAESLAGYGELCGWALARAHARSGDPAAISGYLGSGAGFDRAMASFAERYADQSERDYEALCDAVAAGRLTAQPGL